MRPQLPFFFFVKKNEAKTVFMVCIFCVGNNSICLNDGMLTVLTLNLLCGYR